MPDSVLIQPSRRGSPALIAVALAGSAILAGCAQQRTEGYYNPPAASTITDAQYQGQGAGYRQVVHAPSQLQIELKGQQPGQPRKPIPTAQEEAAEAAAQADAAAAAAAAAGDVSPASKALVPQAQTYMGTLPCLTPSAQCAAQRVTLTLAPNGRWRSRTSFLDSTGNAANPTTEQGCWDATAERPARVLLSDAAGNLRVEFVVAANNVLRVRSVLGKSPNLNYSMTRQPDLDPIDELSKTPAPKCP
ncbi:copper resistance protein NlpE N-terminal domain-containing protein [Bordetella petrii]|uniref:copper resistance protein NlpE N-terminal domain-containing protein n=1 Tax=Bordetella petrii TaxID=94624 RepID=UPI001E4E0A56|nr:copper resistance protein NlpE N-terminal domain-containing protein [Bordetella petrii]MCD0504660.1 copper resistance protein NlpE N-terminal domain-containing protein [Bordetella petrii]